MFVFWCSITKLSISGHLLSRCSKIYESVKLIWHKDYPVRRLWSQTNILPPVSPRQEFRHVFFTHASEHFELLQVAHVGFLIFAIGDAQNDSWSLQF